MHPDVCLIAKKEMDFVIKYAARAIMMSCMFHGTVGTEKLYEGIGNNVDWIANKATGGENMEVPAFQ